MTTARPLRARVVLGLALMAAVPLLVVRPSRADEPSEAASAAPPVRFACRLLVVDAANDKPIPKATLTVVGRTVGVDAAGAAAVELAPGRFDVEARAEGYAVTTARLEVPTTGGVELTLRLTSSTRFRERVDVVAAADPINQSPATLPVSPQQVISVAGGAENVFRVLQTLPGVAGTDEFTGRLAVRGGGPDQNLTIMDGVEIHNPYRLFGLASAFNPETVERFELTAGAFSARYGDRLSSLLVVDNRAGSTSRTLTGSAALSVTDANVILEGRLPKERGSWLLTGRRTYYDLIAERFTDQKLPKFQDLQGRGVLNLGGGRTLTFFSLLSREDTDATYDFEEEAAKGAIFTHTRNDLASATFHTPLWRRGWARTIASTYTNTDSFDFDASFRNEERRSNAPDETGFGTEDIALTWDGAVRDRALRQELGWQLGSRHVLDTGFEVHRLRTSVAWTLKMDRDVIASAGSGFETGGLPDDLDSARSDTRLGAWLQDRWMVSRRLLLEGGLRLDRSNVNERTSLSPRLSGTWSFTPTLRLRAALGLHTQSPGYEKLAQSDYVTDLSGRGPLPLENERARHVLLGLERDLPGGVLVRAEGYYKGFDRLIVGRLETPEETNVRLAEYDFPAELAGDLPREPWLTSVPTNGGSGHAWGVDAYVARRATSPTTRLTGWASYTYGRAERTAYGLTYPFDYDRRHSLSLVASFKPTPRLELSATLRVASGFPYTPVRALRVAGASDLADLDGDGNDSEIVPDRDSEGRLVYTLDRGGAENLNTALLPYYARLDTRSTYTPRWGRGRVRLYLDVINALNRKNAGMITSKLEHDPTSDRPKLVESNEGGIPLLPSFGVHVTFGTPQALRLPSKAARADGQARKRELRPVGGLALALRPGGSQGMGLDIVRSWTRHLSTRLALSAPTHVKIEQSTDGTDYDVTLKLGSVAGLLDLHPFAGSFHLTGGLYATRHRFTFANQTAGTYDVGGVGYTSLEVERLEGSAQVQRRIAPYCGLGWGNAARRKKRFGVNFDVGVLLQGVRSVSLSVSGPATTEPAFAAAAEHEINDLRKRLDGLGVYPVVSLSLSYRLR